MEGGGDHEIQTPSNGGGGFTNFHAELIGGIMEYRMPNMSIPPSRS